MLKIDLFIPLSPLYPCLSAPVHPDSVHDTVIYLVILTRPWVPIFDLCLSLTLRQNQSGSHTDSTSLIPQKPVPFLPFPCHYPSPSHHHLSLIITSLPGTIYAAILALCQAILHVMARFSQFTEHIPRFSQHTEHIPNIFLNVQTYRKVEMILQ